MLQVWTDKPKARAYSAINAITCQHPDIPLEVHNDATVPTGPVVLVLGTFAKELFEQEKTIPKNRTITSLRNRLWTRPNGQKLLFTYSPGIGDIDHGMHVDLLCDVKLAYRAAITGSLQPVLGKYKYVADFQLACGALGLTTGVSPISLDTETIGLDPYAPGAYIVSIQLSIEPGMSHVVTFKSKADYDERMAGTLGDQLRWLLTCPQLRLRMANGKYDLHWFHVHGGFECTNFSMDTTAVGSCLDENRSNSLNVHAKVYTPMGGYDDPFNITADKAHMDKELEKDPESFLIYSGGDTDACLQVSTHLQQEISKVPPLARFYTTILHPALRAFEKVEQCGVCVDKDAYAELEGKLHTQMAESIKTIKELAGGRLLAKHGDDKKFMGLNPSKASFLCDYLFGPAGLNLKPKMFTPKSTDDCPKPSTASDHMDMFADHPEAGPFIKALQDYADANKTMNTYCTGFRKHLRSDGRFHPTYWLFAGDRADDEGGTNTGRLSARDPAIQTVPKHTKWAKYLRRCLIAPPGYRCAELDYSQGELRVIACIADETNMIEAYKQGRDLHATTAGPFRGYDYEQMMALKKTDKALFDSIRQLGKAGNFGLIYGMSPAGIDGDGGFRAYAASSYGVHLTEQEAIDFRNGFFNRYPVLLQYHDMYRKFAQQNGYVMSPLGRIRHLPLINSPDKFTASKARRQCINSPVQSTLSDMMIWCFAIAHQRGWFDESPYFAMVHDAAYMYVPEDNWEQCVKRTKELMENLPFNKVGWKPQLTFTADAKVGPNLADLEEVIFA